MSDLEQRIGRALNGSSNLTAAQLAALLTDTEHGIAAAEQAAAKAQQDAMNPLLAPDPVAAREAIADAEFAAKRLHTLQPKLQRRQQAVADAEDYRKWAATFDALKPKHAAAAEKLRAIYTAFQDQLVEALTQAKQVDAEVQRVAAAKPHHLPQANGDHRALPTVEAAARGVPAVSQDFSIMTMKLPAFDKPNQLAWPPYVVPLAVQVAASMVPVPGDSRQYTGRWHEVQAERAAAARAQAQREQQERQAGADANYHGPRWWERDAS